jgi:predicted TIM-barrel fold metal-dependent hydrolase
MMAVSRYVDIHPHVISDDETRYPLDPLFGKRSEWSKARPCTVEKLIAAMDEAGVDKAAVVHSSTTYGFDNSYVIDSCARYPDRLLAVCSVDLQQPGAPEVIEGWLARGLGGLRVFTGGTTKAFDPSELENPASYPAWELCSDLGLPMCLQTGPVGLPQVAALAKRFPRVPIILDHLGFPELAGGPPYAATDGLFALAEIESIHLKLTPVVMARVVAGDATPESFFPKVVEAFGADRMAWGSNFPATPGTLAEILATAKQRLASLSDDDRTWIFGKTAQKLYRPLAD